MFGFSGNSGSYNLGVGVKYDGVKGERLPVQGTYSVKEIFPEAPKDSTKPGSS